MKVIIINTSSAQQDLVNYGKDLLDKLNTDHEVVTYDKGNINLEEVSELKDSDEKLILFNHFACKNGFNDLTKILPDTKNIKYIISVYSNYSGLDLELLKKLGIKYRNNGGANAKSVAQYALTSMFMLLSKFPMLADLTSIPDGSVLGEEYHNKTAGIIGLGNVGIELLNSLNSLGIKTVYYNRSSKEIPGQVQFSEIFNQDIIFVTISTNPETIALLKDFQSLLKPHQYVVDVTALDNLYNKQELVELVKKNKLKGLALESEDLAKLPREKNHNIVITPHIAWCTVDAEKRTVENHLNRALLILQGRASEIDFLV